MNWKDILFVIALVGAWFVLNRWILPMFGVNTCMSGSCAVGPPPAMREADDESSASETPPATGGRRPVETQGERP